MTIADINRLEAAVAASNECCIQPCAITAPPNKIPSLKEAMNEAINGSIYALDNRSFCGNSTVGKARFGIFNSGNRYGADGKKEVTELNDTHLFMQETVDKLKKEIDSLTKDHIESMHEKELVARRAWSKKIGKAIAKHTEKPEEVMDVNKIDTMEILKAVTSDLEHSYAGHNSLPKVAIRENEAIKKYVEAFLAIEVPGVIGSVVLYENTVIYDLLNNSNPALRLAFCSVFGVKAAPITVNEKLTQAIMTLIYTIVSEVVELDGDYGESVYHSIRDTLTVVKGVHGENTANIKTLTTMLVNMLILGTDKCNFPNRDNTFCKQLVPEESVLDLHLAYQEHRDTVKSVDAGVDEETVEETAEYMRVPARAYCCVTPSVLAMVMGNINEFPISSNDKIHSFASAFFGMMRPIPDSSKPLISNAVVKSYGIYVVSKLLTFIANDMRACADSDIMLGAVSPKPYAIKDLLRLFSSNAPAIDKVLSDTVDAPGLNMCSVQLFKLIALCDIAKPKAVKATESTEEDATESTEEDATEATEEAATEATEEDPRA